MILAAKIVYFLSTPPQNCLFPVQFCDEPREPLLHENDGLPRLVPVGDGKVGSLCVLQP